MLFFNWVEVYLTDTSAAFLTLDQKYVSFSLSLVSLWTPPRYYILLYPSAPTTVSCMQLVLNKCLLPDEWTKTTDLRGTRVSDIHLTKDFGQKRPWSFNWMQVQYETKVFYKLSKSKGDLNCINKSMVYARTKQNKKIGLWYLTLIRPHLEYYYYFLSPHYKKKIEKLEMFGNCIKFKKLTEQGLFILEKRRIRRFDHCNYSRGPWKTEITLILRNT